MKLPPKLLHWARKTLKIVAVVWLVYVVVLNALLQIPLTQTVINKIRPEKFAISWDNAWTLVPGRVHVSGARANGNARSQMWQVEVGAASGSIALLPLIAKRVWVDDVAGEDIRFRLRPRPKGDTDYSRIEAFFPEIEGREVTPAVTTPRKKRRSWHISVDDIHVTGPLDYWIFNVRGQADGEIGGQLKFLSPGGPLELDVSDFELELGRHTINGDNEIFPQGRLAGSMGFTPFMPLENKGLAMLKYLLVDADVDIETNSLRFIKLFLLNFDGLDVDGNGKVSGRLHFEQGQVREGTDLAINARDLRVEIPGHSIHGKGDVHLGMGPETGGLMDLSFRFRDLEVVQEGDDRAMLTGQDLLLRIGGDGRVLPNPEQINLSREIGLQIEALSVPDLALFQRYIPEKWPVALNGGKGTLEGGLRLTPKAFDVDLALRSDEADMSLSQYRFETDLDAALKMTNPAIMNSATAVAGSSVVLSEARLLRDGQKSEETWSASLTLKEGEFELLGKRRNAGDGDVVDLFRILGDTEAKALLAESGGLFDFEAEVSSLAWISAFLGKQYNSEFHGSSTIAGSLALESGLPAPGTDMEVRSSELVVTILDYVSRGDGVIALKVEEGGELPDWRMTLALGDAELRRHSDEKAYIQDVDMRVDALVQDVDFDPENQQNFEMQFGIDSGRVTDMSVFNAYLPPDSPVAFESGEAQLGADILLKQDDADGWLKLDSQNIELVADGQALLADLGMEVKLAGGVPADMQFDITGSRVVLANVRVKGAAADFDEEAWKAEVELLRGNTVFRDPLELDVEVGLKVSDSRPIVAMFQNQDGWRPEFLAAMMTLEDIEGSGEMTMANDRIVIPFAHLTSDNAEAGMKGVITETDRDGVIYFRYKKFDTVLKVRDGKRDLDVFGALRTYEEYVPPAQ